MPRPFTPKVVTANDLLQGDVVYLNENREWVRFLHQAHVLTDADEAATWLQSAALQINHVVGVYLADAMPHADGPQPAHFREDFRSKGPSNYPHGKQTQPQKGTKSFEQTPLNILDAERVQHV